MPRFVFALTKFDQWLQFDSSRINEFKSDRDKLFFIIPAFLVYLFTPSFKEPCHRRYLALRSVIRRKTVPGAAISSRMRRRTEASCSNCADGIPPRACA